MRLFKLNILTDGQMRGKLKNAYNIGQKNGYNVDLQMGFLQESGGAYSRDMSRAVTAVFMMRWQEELRPMTNSSMG